MPKKSVDRLPIILRGRLNGPQRGRLLRLLDMMYTPKELAQEVGFSTRQVYRVYIPGGCPHERDTQKRIWINGKVFREWYQQAYRKPRIPKGFAFCLTCKRGVKMVNPTKHQRKGLSYLLCACPHCGRQLARIISMKRDQT